MPWNQRYGISDMWGRLRLANVTISSSDLVWLGVGRGEIWGRCFPALRGESFDSQELSTNHVLPQQDMTLQDRERIFKNVTPTDRFTPKQQNKQDEEEDDDEGIDSDPDAPNMPDQKGMVVGWWMELHSRVECSMQREGLPHLSLPVTHPLCPIPAKKPQSGGPNFGLAFT